MGVIAALIKQVKSLKLKIVKHFASILQLTKQIATKKSKQAIRDLHFPYIPANLTADLRSNQRKENQISNQHCCSQQDPINNKQLFQEEADTKEMKLVSKKQDLITTAVGCSGASTVSSSYNFAKVFAFVIQQQPIPRTESPQSYWYCCNGIGNTRGSDFGRGILSGEAFTDLSSTPTLVNFECVNGATPVVYHTLTAAIH